jgi:hypothetical protein
MSGIGAEVVVRTALKLLSVAFDEIYEMCLESDVVARSRIHQVLLKALSKAALQHGCEIADLASTFLFVAHKGSRFLAGHIGDGVIAQVINGEPPSVLSHPDNGEFANTTVFVTDSICLDRFRLFHGVADSVTTGFVIMSDGCAESLYDKRSRSPATAIVKLLEWNRQLSRNKMDRILMANLREAFSLKSTDDCSLALLSVVQPIGARSVLAAL